MNDMTTAMVKAGVKLPPQNQRIWQWLKDNGPHSVRDLASELKIGEATVQAAISVMVRRNMLEKIERQDHKMMRLNNHYTALGKTYVLLPEPPKRGAAGRAAANAKRTAPEDSYLPTATTTPMFSPEKLLESLTLAQARQVYVYLGRLFK